MENLRKIYDLWKIYDLFMENLWKIYGKPGNHKKTLKNNGNRHLIHGKS